jgi:hypothetical protein
MSHTDFVSDKSRSPFRIRYGLRIGLPYVTPAYVTYGLRIGLPYVTYAYVTPHQTLKKNRRTKDDDK